MEEFVQDLQEKRKQKEENSNSLPKEEYNESLKDNSSNLENSLEYNDVEILHLDNNENNIIDISFKIIVIGNSAVGKSSLVDRVTKNKFLEDYSATIGFDYSSFFIKYDNKTIKLQIWDTCGQEIYQSLITNFYRNSSLAIMVYAINNRESFDNLDNWIKELKKESNPDVKTILIGNKVDLESERKISYKEAEKYSKDLNFISFYETSAKTGFNTQKVFIKSAIILYEDFIKYQESNSMSENEKKSNNSKSQKLTKKSDRKIKAKKKSKCC